MGRGNWFPGRSDTPKYLCYIDLTDDSEDPFPEDLAWEDFQNNLVALLGKSWSNCKADLESARKAWNREYGGGWGCRGDLVVAANGLLCVVVDVDAEYHHVGVALCVIPTDDYYADERSRAALAQATLDRAGPGFLKKVSQAAGGKVPSVRTNAWISEPAWSAP